VAHLPGEPQPVSFSVHGAIAAHYKVDPATLKESHSSTIDYVISATAGWMMGTFGGALEARQIDASNGKLTADVTGEVEKEEGVLVIRRIHVAMRLVAPEDVKETVERVHGMYAMRCPLYRTLHNAIQLTSGYTLVAPAAAWRCLASFPKPFSNLWFNLGSYLAASQHSWAEKKLFGWLVR
jgi:uncharacterized OsmC-like protein